jgi:hypothetical protein
MNHKTNQIDEFEKIIGTITSRPLFINIIKNNTKLEVYYIDYLCVDKNERKQNVATQLIQTHEYNQRRSNKKIAVSLFKREEELTNIVPIVVYQTFCFSLTVAENYNINIGQYFVEKCNKQTIHLLYDFIQTNKMKWDVMVFPCLSNIIELIQTNNLFIYMLLLNNHIYAIYIYKVSCCKINGFDTITLISSSMNSKLFTKNNGDFTHLFIKGFLKSLFFILKKSKNNRYLIIENLADNYTIIDNLKKTHKYISSPMAYYFYNYAHSPFLHKKCFFIV